jgi:hypothetical protein
MNRIIIKRIIDGYTIKAVAHYLPTEDGWECRVKEGAVWVEARDPDETGNDVWATLVDMIDLALETARQRDAMNAGPFSSAQCHA